MKIYNLLNDAENYRWLEYKGNWFDFFHSIIVEPRKIDNFDKVIDCTVIRDKKERILGDYPVFTVPAISQKAKDVLEPLISDYVQIFPLNVKNKNNYYFLNIFNLLDCLDIQNSDVTYLTNSTKIFEIQKWKFNEKLNEENSRFFFLKNQMGERLYVNEEVKKVIEENDLEGFVFKEVGEI